MTLHTFHPSDLDLLLSKVVLTEKDVIDFPMFDITSAASITSQPCNQTLLKGTITHPNYHRTFVFNGSIKKEKTEYSLEEPLEK